MFAPSNICWIYTNNSLILEPQLLLPKPINEHDPKPGEYSSHHITIRSITMLSSQLLLSLPRDQIPDIYSPKFCMHFMSSSPKCILILSSHYHLILPMWSIPKKVFPSKFCVSYLTHLTYMCPAHHNILNLTKLAKLEVKYNHKYLIK